MSDRRDVLPDDTGGGAADPNLDDIIDDLDPDIDDADDGGGDDLDPGPADVDADPEPPRQSRRERQADNWRNRATAAETRAALLEQRMATLEGRATMPDPQAAARAQAEQDRQFRDSLIGLMPEEISERVAQRSEQRMAAALQQLRVEAFDNSDRGKYEQLAARDRFAAAKEREVETLLANARAQGIYQFGRLDVLDLLRGREFRLRGERTTQQQRRTAAQRIDRETVRPPSGRGDGDRGNARRGNQGDADLALLRSTRIADL